MTPKTPFQLRKHQFYTLLLFGLLITLCQAAFVYYKNHSEKEFPNVVFISDEKTPILLTEFNPNELDERQWQKLGFTEKQVKTILNYKQIVGGNFTSKEQLKKCYAISKEKYTLIESYILLPETKNKEKTSIYPEKQLKISGRFNPDLYSEKDWQIMGFSEKQAAAIMKYKKYLGGSFESKEKFKECFIINEKNYEKLSPYLILPDKSAPNNKLQKKAKFENNYFEFNPNSLDVQGWQKLGFSEKQAQVIVNYRDKNLKGGFRSLEEIQKCFVISDEKFKDLLPYIKLSPAKPISSQTIASPKAISKTEFSKTDLNKITFAQLVEFGFDEKSAASYIGFRNKLGGFLSKNQILETYNLDKNLAEKLVAISPINTANIEKYSILDAPEEWLQNHPYFRYYANKIIFYRISYSSEKEIFKKLKAKPDDEAKMKLYLK